MNLRKEQIQMVRETKKAKFLPNGFIQIIIFIVLFFFAQIFSFIVSVIITQDLEPSHLAMLYSTIIPIIIFVAYLLLVERRNLFSIGFGKPHAIKDYMIGYFVGVLMFSMVILTLFLTHNLTYEGFQKGSLGIILLFFGGFLIQGMSEEVIMRGYLLNSIGARHNLVIAILINSILFGVLHLLNPNVSFLSILNIILFGVFASIYALQFNNIWGVGALHSAWNFVQGNIYGLEVSGLNIDASIWRFKASGNELMNGGAFGPEGGIVTTFVLIISTIIVYQLKLKRNQ